MNKDVAMKGQEPARRPRRTKGPPARQPLPSSGISFEGQLKMLRAYVNASDGGAKPVSLDRLSAVTQVSRYTVSSCNRFFDASKFIIKEKNGYRPTEGLISFVKQLPWNEERAKSFLHNMMEDTWYKKELHVLFGTNPTMTTDDLVIALGSSVGARPDQKASLETLVKFIKYAGLVTVDLDSGKLALGEAVTPEDELLRSELELASRRAAQVPEAQRMKVGEVAATLAINLNLTLDITSGTPDEHVRKIKEILEGLSKEES